jgi:hypothetical protein
LRLFILKGLENGTPHALFHNRRSGAQRGAPENNFGQRFSWAPLAIFVKDSGKAPPKENPLSRIPACRILRAYFLKFLVQFR